VVFLVNHPVHVYSSRKMVIVMAPGEGEGGCMFVMARGASVCHPSRSLWLVEEVLSVW